MTTPLYETDAKLKMDTVDFYDFFNSVEENPFMLDNDWTLNSLITSSTKFQEATASIQPIKSVPRVILQSVPSNAGTSSQPCIVLDALQSLSAQTFKGAVSNDFVPQKYTPNEFSSSTLVSATKVDTHNDLRKNSFVNESDVFKKPMAGLTRATSQKSSRLHREPKQDTNCPQPSPAAKDVHPQVVTMCSTDSLQIVEAIPKSWDEIAKLRSEVASRQKKQDTATSRSNHLRTLNPAARMKEMSFRKASVGTALNPYDVSGVFEATSVSTTLSLPTSSIVSTSLSHVPAVEEHSFAASCSNQPTIEQQKSITASKIEERAPETVVKRNSANETTKVASLSNRFLLDRFGGQFATSPQPAFVIKSDEMSQHSNLEPGMCLKLSHVGSFQLHPQASTNGGADDNIHLIESQDGSLLQLQLDESPSNLQTAFCLNDLFLQAGGQTAFVLDTSQFSTATSDAISAIATTQGLLDQSTLTFYHNNSSDVLGVPLNKRPKLVHWPMPVPPLSPISVEPVPISGKKISTSTTVPCNSNSGVTAINRLDSVPMLRFKQLRQKRKVSMDWRSSVSSIYDSCSEASYCSFDAPSTSTTCSYAEEGLTRKSRISLSPQTSTAVARGLLSDPCSADLGASLRKWDPLFVGAMMTPVPDDMILAREEAIFREKEQQYQNEQENLSSKPLSTEKKLSKRSEKVDFSKIRHEWERRRAARVRPFENFRKLHRNWFYHLCHPKRACDPRLRTAKGFCGGPKETCTVLEKTQGPKKIIVSKHLYSQLRKRLESVSLTESTCSKISLRHRRPKICEVSQSVLTANFPLSTIFRYLKPAKLLLGRSLIHGTGLFAAETIEKGDFICEYFGEIIRSTVADVRERAYAQKDLSTYMFRLDRDYVIDATMKGGAARFSNHSCAPNCASRCVTSFDKKKHILLVALRKIEEGQEIVHDYRLSPGDGPMMACNCKSPACRINV